LDWYIISNWNIGYSLAKGFCWIITCTMLMVITSCECPTSDNIDSQTIPLSGAGFQIVDATNNESGLYIEIAEIPQIEIPKGFPLPFEGKIESGRQVVTIYSDDSFYYSGPISTDSTGKYIGILQGIPLFAEFDVLMTDTLPNLSIYNASDKILSIESGVNTIQEILPRSFDTIDSGSELGISGISFSPIITEGMIIILDVTEQIQYAEVSF